MRFRPVVVVALLVVMGTGVVVGSAAPASPSTDTTVAASTAAASTMSDSAPDGIWMDASVAGSSTSTIDSSSTASPFDRADPGLVLTIQLEENGDARWHITHRFQVNDTNETAAFEEFATAVENGERNVGTTKATFSRFAESASTATGREMAIEDAEWSNATITNGTGAITYSFTWTNFGRVDGDKLRVGDAFQSPNGTWLPRLYDGQRLVIRPPDTLAIIGTPPDKGVTDRALVWDGYREFQPGYLNVVLDAREQPGTTTTTEGPGDSEMEVSPFLLGVGFALLLVLVGVGSYLFARRQTIADEDGASGGPSDDDGTGRPPAGAQSAAGNGDDGDVMASDDGGGRADDGSPPSAGDGPAGSGAVAGGNNAVAAETEDRAASTSDGTATTPEESGTAAGTREPQDSDDATVGAVEGADADDEVDETLLSDEERVLRLLDENGGRMKQANIVSETGWSNAKVSQLLSGMDEDDAIQKLRIGRENLITLPEENVADFGNNDG